MSGRVLRTWPNLMNVVPSSVSARRTRASCDSLAMRWKPLGVMGACLALCGADALELRLADQNQVPTQVWGVVAAIAAALAIYYVVRARQRRPRKVAIILSTMVAISGVILVLASPHVDLPDELWRSLPFLLALVVLGGALTRAHMPAKLTLPYTRGED